MVRIPCWHGTSAAQHHVTTGVLHFGVVVGQVWDGLDALAWRGDLIVSGECHTPVLASGHAAQS